LCLASFTALIAAAFVFPSGRLIAPSVIAAGIVPARIVPAEFVAEELMTRSFEPSEIGVARRPSPCEHVGESSQRVRELFGCVGLIGAQHGVDQPSTLDQAHGDATELVVMDDDLEPVAVGWASIECGFDLTEDDGLGIDGRLGSRCGLDGPGCELERLRERRPGVGL